MKARILVVDDEPNILSTLADVLGDQGYEVVTAGRIDAAMAAAEAEPPDLVLLDVMLTDGSGLDLLRRLKARQPEVEVVMISGHASVDIAVEAIRAGAYDFIEKPLSLKRVVPTVARALERRNMKLDRTARESAEDERYRVVGESPAMKTVMSQVAQAAPTAIRVLVTGESGTGKELVAYWLHRLSSRRDRPLVKLNCAAIPRDLLESELFGHEKGAFTGAVARKPGKFELADTGTMFLDEIGDMEANLQAKLLRVLEGGEFERLGSTKPIKVDVRVVAATNKDIPAEIRQGRFRADLYHRLNAFRIHIPALREHSEDVPALAAYLLESYCRENGMSSKRLADDAVRYLSGLSFPGNVRELRNIVERAAILTPGSEVPRSALLPAPGAAASDDADIVSRTRPLADAREEFERAFLLAQMARFGWNITLAAGELQIERTNLSRRLKQLGIDKPAPYA